MSAQPRLSTLRAALGRRYAREQFFPGWLGLAVNPYFLARRGLLEALRPLAAQARGRILDVGCGQKPYQELFDAAEFIGLEYDSPENRANKRADFFYDGTRFPFTDGAFDTVFCSQVLEHVFTPGPFLAEIQRVLRPGGSFLLTVPFVWEEHEQPQDCARYSSFGLRALLDSSGFQVVQLDKTLPDVRVLFQLLGAYLFQRLATRSHLLNVALCAALVAPLGVLGSVLAWITPETPTLYLDNVVLAKKR